VREAFNGSRDTSKQARSPRGFIGTRSESLLPTCGSLAGDLLSGTLCAVPVTKCLFARVARRTERRLTVVTHATIIEHTFFDSEKQLKSHGTRTMKRLSSGPIRCFDNQGVLRSAHTKGQVSADDGKGLDG